MLCLLNWCPWFAPHWVGVPLTLFGGGASSKKKKSKVKIKGLHDQHVSSPYTLYYCSVRSHIESLVNKHPRAQSAPEQKATPSPSAPRGSCPFVASFLFSPWGGLGSLLVFFGPGPRPPSQGSLRRCLPDSSSTEKGINYKDHWEVDHPHKKGKVAVGRNIPSNELWCLFFP